MAAAGNTLATVTVTGGRGHSYVFLSFLSVAAVEGIVEHLHSTRLCIAIQNRSPENSSSSRSWKRFTARIATRNVLRLF